MNRNNIYHSKPKTDRVCTVPQSLLQRISCAAQFAINFKLQHFHASGLRELKLSNKTLSLMINHNVITEELKESIQEDYDAHKEEILAARKSLKESFDIAARDAKGNLL